MARKKQLTGETTTIMITQVTKERLMKYGKIGDTYDITINRLIDSIEKKE